MTRNPETTAPSPSAAASTVTLRHATRRDLAAVERLLADAKLTTAGVAALFDGHAADFIVADDPDRDGELAAVGGLEVCCDNALLRSVAVRPEWRSRGLGRELVRRLVCEAESRGLDALYLLTTTAEHYFPRFGFEPVERERVPTAIRETLEFRSACPASAVAMTRAIRPHASARG